MNGEPYITAYETGEKIPLQGKVFTINDGKIIVQCVVWHTIAIPWSATDNKLGQWDPDQEHLTLKMALSHVGGDTPCLIRKVAVDDFLDIFDSVRWYAIPLTRSNLLALLSAGYTAASTALAECTPFLPSPDAIAEVKVAVDAFISTSLQSRRTEIDDMFARARTSRG